MAATINTTDSLYDDLKVQWLTEMVQERTSAIMGVIQEQNRPLTASDISHLLGESSLLITLIRELAACGYLDQDESSGEITYTLHSRTAGPALPLPYYCWLLPPVK